MYKADILYITHQCARFSSCTENEYDNAVRWLARYFIGTRDRGTIFKTVYYDNIEVYIDADFAENWDPK